MAENQQESTKDVFHQAAVKLGFKFVVDEDEVNKNLNPILDSIKRKLRGLNEEAELKKGWTGDNFFSKKVKEFTGFDTTLVRTTQNMIALGRASKEGVNGEDVDQGKFYNSLNFIQKKMVDMAGEKDRAKKQDLENIGKEKKAQSDLQQVYDSAGKLQKDNLDRGLSEGVEKLDNLDSIEKKTLEATDADKARIAELQKSLLTADTMMGDLAQGLDKNLTGITGGMGTVGEAAGVMGEEIGVAMAEATGGLSVVLGIVVMIAEALGKAMYKLWSAVMTTRMEVKKFDQLLGGVDAEGVLSITQDLHKMNKELWGLGMSIEKVDAVMLGMVKQGVNYSRTMDTTLVKSVLTLSGALGGALGVASEEISALYGNLLRDTLMTSAAMKDMGNSLITINLAAKKTGTLGQVSFAAFAESIKTSGNALAIASAKGDEWAKRMTRDLTALAQLATTLNISLSEMNSKFEEAGSMILNQESGFRTMLALSGGANINQMLTNQFDKTDAMLKAAKYLQEMNKSFGGNIAITAQFAQQSLGINKDMAIKLINMRQEAMDDMRKSQAALEAMRNDEAEKAYDKVNSDLSSMWARLKMMFSNFFFEAFGQSSGMARLMATLEKMLARVHNFLTNSKTIENLSKIVENIADWIGDKLTQLVTWLSQMFDEFSDPDKNPIVSIWETLIDKLNTAAQGVGKALLVGMLKGAGSLLLTLVLMVARVALGLLTRGLSEALFAGLGWLFGKEAKDESGNQSDIKQLQEKASSHEKRTGEINKEESELRRWSPDTVTYGKFQKDGPSGFMTVGQKEASLAEEREKEQAELKKIQEDIRNATQESADIAAGRKKPDGTAVEAHNYGSPTPKSPVAFGSGFVSGEYTEGS